MEACVLNLHSMTSGAERRNIAPPPGNLKISCGPGPNYGDFIRLDPLMKLLAANRLHPNYSLCDHYLGSYFFGKLMKTATLLFQIFGLNQVGTHASAVK